MFGITQRADTYSAFSLSYSDRRLHNLYDQCDVVVAKWTKYLCTNKMFRFLFQVAHTMNQSNVCRFALKTRLECRQRTSKEVHHFGQTLEESSDLCYKGLL